MSLRRRSDRRKKQTRLSFTPLPSSSPARSLAHVRVLETSSPAKRRRTDPTSSPSATFRDSPPSSWRSSDQHEFQVLINPDSISPHLPTPAASSQLKPTSAQEAEDLIQNDTIKNRDTPVSRSTQRSRESLTSTRSNGANIQPEATDHGIVASLESSEEDVVIVPRTNRKPKPAAPNLESSDESEPITPRSSLVKRAQGVLPGLGTPTSSKSSPAKRPTARHFLLGAMGGSAPLSHSQGRTSRNAPKRIQQSRRLRHQSSDSSTQSNTDTSFSAFPQRSLRSSKVTKPERGKMGTNLDHTHDDLEGDVQHLTPKMRREIPISPDGRSEAQTISAVRPKQTVSVLISSGSHASSESDIVRTPALKPSRKARLTDGKPKEDGSESLNLQDEVEDLHDSEAEIRESRTRGRSNDAKRNERLNKLEELRRRRKGAPVSESNGENDGSESEPEEIPGPKWSNDLDEYDEDFVDDADDAALGVDLARSGVPIHLTGQANMKPLEYFKYEVEWMIHNKIDPAFERHDEIYLMARQKLDDEVQGHAGSTFKSAAWNSGFVKALTKRPDIFRVDVSTMFEHKCDACSRSGHPPKHKLTFQGSSYDKDSLEKIPEKSKEETDSEDSEDDDESRATEPEDSFFVGRFCCANAEIAHTLYHWRFHLNQTILAWLMTHGHTAPEKIIQRESWSRRKRNKLAIKIVDGMVDSGEMRNLYRQFKENLDAARSAKPDRFSSGRKDVDFG